MEIFPFFGMLEYCQINKRSTYSYGNYFCDRYPRHWAHKRKRLVVLPSFLRKWRADFYAFQPASRQMPIVQFLYHSQPLQRLPYRPFRIFRFPLFDPDNLDDDWGWNKNDRTRDIGSIALNIKKRPPKTLKYLPKRLRPSAFFVRFSGEKQIDRRPRQKHEGVLYRFTASCFLIFCCETTRKQYKYAIIK